MAIAMIKVKAKNVHKDFRAILENPKTTIADLGEASNKFDTKIKISLKGKERANPIDGKHHGEHTLVEENGDVTTFTKEELDEKTGKIFDKIKEALKDRLKNNKCDCPNCTGLAAPYILVKVKDQVFLGATVDKNMPRNEAVYGFEKPLEAHGRLNYNRHDLHDFAREAEDGTVTIMEIDQNIADVLCTLFGVDKFNPLYTRLGQNKTVVKKEEPKETDQKSK